MGKNRIKMPITFLKGGKPVVTSVDFDEYGTMRASTIQELNNSKIDEARRTSKEGNWHDGNLARLNKGNVSDLDYLNEQATTAGFQIDSIKNTYNHNNIHLHHPDHPDLDVVVDKLALQSMLSNTSNMDYDLSDVLTKINTGMAESNSFMFNTNTVTIAARQSNQPAFNQVNKDGVRNLVINTVMEGNDNKNTLFENMDNYVADNQ